MSSWRPTVTSAPALGSFRLYALGGQQIDDARDGMRQGVALVAHVPGYLRYAIAIQHGRSIHDADVVLDHVDDVLVAATVRDRES